MNIKSSEQKLMYTFFRDISISIPCIVYYVHLIVLMVVDQVHPRKTS